MSLKMFGMAAIALAALTMATPSAAAEPMPAMSNPTTGVPVFPGDITDRPYRVIGEIKTGVRKATIFSKSSSEAKIYRELWERAEKMGADAVIKAQYGKSKVSLDS